MVQPASQVLAAEQFAEDHVGRTVQSGARVQGGQAEPQVAGGQRQGAAVDAFTDGGQQDLPGDDHPAAQEHKGRIEEAQERREGLPEQAPGPGDQVHGGAVPAFGGVQHGRRMIARCLRRPCWPRSRTAGGCGRPRRPRRRRRRPGLPGIASSYPTMMMRVLHNPRYARRVHLRPAARPSPPRCPRGLDRVHPRRPPRIHHPGPARGQPRQAGRQRRRARFSTPVFLIAADPW